MTIMMMMMMVMMMMWTMRLVMMRMIIKACGFRHEQAGGKGDQHWATKGEQQQQCQEYLLYKTWARQACLLSEPEFKAQLSAAHQLRSNQRGIEGLPSCLHCRQTTGRNHAVLLCRAAGLRKASEACKAMRRLGGRAEMDRLLALPASALESERLAVSSTLRREPAVQLTTPCAREAEAQLRAVVGLFRVWLFRVGAQDLGATEAW